MNGFVSPDALFMVGGSSGATQANAMHSIGVEKFGRIVTAVTTGDDGGASRELLNVFGGSSTGDCRKVFSHLLPDLEVRQALEGRCFFDADNNPYGLMDRHPLGSLLYVALRNGLSVPLQHYDGLVDDTVLANAQSLLRNNRDNSMSGEDALALMGEQFGLPPNVTILPMTQARTGVVARLHSGENVVGESNIGYREQSEAYEIADRIALFDYGTSTPENGVFMLPILTEGLLETIRSARNIVIGPGSIETTKGQLIGDESVVQAILASDAPLTLVLNIAGDCSTADEIAFFERHIGPGRINTIIANSDTPNDPTLSGQFVRLENDPRIVASKLYSFGESGSDPDKRAGIIHDPLALGTALVEVLGIRVAERV